MSNRKTLPNRRAAETVTFNWGRWSYSITFGFFDDEQSELDNSDCSSKLKPAEVFVSGSVKNLNTELDAVARDGALLVSLALQYGCSAETLANAVSRNGGGEPASIIGAVIDQIVKRAANL
jgi:ribonucleoside-diphosphate reductase alpha chain